MSRPSSPCFPPHPTDSATAAAEGQRRSKRKAAVSSNISRASDADKERMREKRISKLESDATDYVDVDGDDDDEDFDVRAPSNRPARPRSAARPVRPPRSAGRPPTAPLGRRARSRTTG